MGLDKNEMARAMKNDTAHIRPVHLGDFALVVALLSQRLDFAEDQRFAAG